MWHARTWSPLWRLLITGLSAPPAAVLPMREPDHHVMHERQLSALLDSTYGSNQGLAKERKV
jgi:hypothetical protein